MWIACKLPHGLTIRHKGQEINLNGPNEGYDPTYLAPNGRVNDGEKRSGGFGLTELTGEKADAFNDWVNSVTYKNGKAAEGKLAEPFLALENGQIMSFKDEKSARDETKTMSDAIVTGTEGIDPETDKQMKASGLETADKK